MLKRSVAMSTQDVEVWEPLGRNMSVLQSSASTILSTLADGASGRPQMLSPAWAGASKHDCRQPPFSHTRLHAAARLLIQGRVSAEASLRHFSLHLRFKVRLRAMILCSDLTIMIPQWFLHMLTSLLSGVFRGRSSSQTATQTHSVREPSAWQSE